MINTNLKICRLNSFKNSRPRLKIPSEIENFQSDLLESVKQMKTGKAARVTEIKIPQAAEARSRVGLSQPAFARLLGVSARTLQGLRRKAA